MKPEIKQVGKQSLAKKTKKNQKQDQKLDELSAIDLFSGCGGLTLGLKLAGFNVIGAVDIDPQAVETYRRNHNEVHVWETDIAVLSVSEVMKKLGLKKGGIDLLAGCPPCQGFSTLRTFNGAKSITDSKNDLLFQFLRFAEELLPKTIMMENVPGLAVDERLTRFQKRLESLGYKCNCDVLDAAKYGVPQRRRRMIFLAGMQNKIEFADADTQVKTVRDAIFKLKEPGNSGDLVHDLPERRSEKVISLIRRIPKDGGSRNDLSREEQLDCHKKCDGFKDVYGRMAWDKVAPTITSGCTNPSKGRFVHPERDRSITLREAALLQTFPDNYYFSLKRGKGAAALMIGNALPPEFIRRHALKIRDYLTAYHHKNQFDLSKSIT